MQNLIEILIVLGLIVGLPIAGVWWLVSLIRSWRRIERENRTEIERHRAAMRADAERFEAIFARQLQTFRDDVSDARAASTRQTRRRRTAAGAAAAAGAAGASAAGDPCDDASEHNSDDGFFDDRFDCSCGDMRDINFVGEWHELTGE
jgi:Tfp pilus assembly protein PilE